MKLNEILDALRAVRDPDTNHRGLLSLRRHVSRSRPAADNFVLSLLQQSPGFTELHAIWEVQVSAKDIKTTLELLSCTTALLSYRPSANCPADQKQQIITALDTLAGVLVQRRLKPLYFHLSSGSKPRCNAALALLTAVASRGGSVLRELVAGFDFSHLALPKLARPPKTSAAAAAMDDDTAAAAAAAAGSGEEADVPPHWLSWNDLSVSRRPSRAVFIEWVAMMLQVSDPLLLPVLLQTRPLMSGLLNHLASDPPDVILGVLQLLHDRFVTHGSNSVGVSAATQLDIWGDAALAQLAAIAAAAAAAKFTAVKTNTAAAERLAAVISEQGTGSMSHQQQDDDQGMGLQVLGLQQQQQQRQNSDDADGSSNSGSSSSSSDEQEDSDSSSSSDVSDVEVQEQGAQQANGQQQQQQRQQQRDDPKADDAAAAAAAAAYKMLLMLLTDPAMGLLSSSSSSQGQLQWTDAAATSVAAAADTSNMNRLETALANSNSSTKPAAAAAAGHLRALRLLQRLQPWQHAAHARILKAVAEAKPQLAAELLQSGLGSYPLEPKPCLSFFGSVGVVNALIAAAAAAGPFRAVMHHCKHALAAMQTYAAGDSTAAAAGSSALVPPNVDGPVVRAAIKCCLPNAIQKGLLSRGLQHQNPLVVSATLTLMQQCTTAMQQLLEPVQQVTAAAAAAVLDWQQQQQQVLNASSAAAALADLPMHWASFLSQIRQNFRLRLPDVSVLVALMTNLQRSATAAAAAAAGSSDKQQQQQCNADQLVLLQMQVYGALRSYVHCIPEAVSDGHVDVWKLLLQGQDLLSAPPDVQLAALKVLAAADPSAAVLPDSSSMSIACLLPLLKLIAVSPAAAVRELAAALLSSRMAPYCGSSAAGGSSSSSSSDVEVQIWLQHLPQIWRIACITDHHGSASIAAAMQPAHSDQSQVSKGTGNMLYDEWLSAQLAVLNFVGEALIAVARKPQEPWETMQQALAPLTAAAAAAAGSSPSSSSEDHALIAPSLLAVCAFRKMLKLLKSQKAAAAVKAAVCGYVCSIWQQLLLQQVDHLPVLLLLKLLLHEEGDDWAAAAAAASAADVAAAAAAGSSGSSKKLKRRCKEQNGDQLALPVVECVQQQQQQQQQSLLLPAEAQPVASLYSKLLTLHHHTSKAAAAAAAVNGALYNLTALRTEVGSSKSQKKRSATVLDGADEPHHSLLLLPTPLPTSSQQQQQQQLLAKIEEAVSSLVTMHDGSSDSSSLAATAAGAAMQAMQQLQLELLMTPAAAVIKITNLLLSRLISTTSTLQLSTAAAAAAGSNGPKQTSEPAAAAAAAAAWCSVIVQQMLVILAAHGSCIADLVHSSSSTSSSIADGCGDAISILAFAWKFSCNARDKLLLCCNMLESSFASMHTAAAAAVGELKLLHPPLAQHANWRGAVLSLLFSEAQQQQQQQQGLSIIDKQQLVNIVCCGMARVAAAAAAQQQQRQCANCDSPADVMLAFGVQLLQALMCNMPRNNYSETSAAAAAAGGGAGSSSDGIKTPVVHSKVAAAVLSHHVLVQGYLGSSSSSVVLTKHIILLITWLLHTARLKTAAAAAAVVGGGEQPEREAIVNACLPYVTKAITVVQHSVDSLMLASRPHKNNSSSTSSSKRQQQVLADHVVELAAAACLRLLPLMDLTPSRNSMKSSSSSSYAMETSLLQQLEHLAKSLLAVYSGSSSNADKMHFMQQQNASQQQQAWLPELLLVLAQLLITNKQQQRQQWRWQQQQQPFHQLHRDLFQFVLQHFLGNACNPAVDACVAAALVQPQQQCTAAAAAAAANALSNVIQPTRSQPGSSSSLQELAATPKVLAACLSQPLNPTRLAAAAQIIKIKPDQTILQCFAAAVEPCIQQASAAAGQNARREALALLLPPAAAYLDALLDSSNGTTAAAAAAVGDRDPVVAVFKGPLLAYMQQKQSKTKQQQQQQACDASDSSSNALSAAATKNLQQYALPVMQLCLTAAPLDDNSREKLLIRLLPAAGYPAAAAAAAAAAAEAVATPEQRLQLAAWVIQQQQQQQLKEVAAFVTCSCSSLAAQFKHNPLQQQQQQGTDNSFFRTSLEQLLLHQLNSWAGDFLAELPDIYRGSSSSSENATDNALVDDDELAVGRTAFAAVLAAVRRLAVPLLQYRFADVAAMRCLRRLLAALLPGGMGTDNAMQDDTAAAAADLMQDGDADNALEEAMQDVDPSLDTDEPMSVTAAAADVAMQGRSASDGSSSSDSDDSSDDEADLVDGDSHHQRNDDLQDDESSDPSEPDHPHGVDQDQQQRDSSSSASGGCSSSDEDSDITDRDVELTAASEQQQGVFNDDNADPSAAAAAAMMVNPAAAAAASDLLQLLTSHSAFTAALLLPEQQPLPAAVAAVPTPLSSYMPVVDAIWCSAAATAAGSSSSDAFALKHQLVLLLEVLLEMQRAYVADDQSNSVAMHGDNAAGIHAAAAAAEGSADQPLLLSLLQLLQVAHGGTLSDGDRAICRLLLLLDKIVPQQQQQQQQEAATMHSAQAEQQDPSTAAGSALPLPWPRCLFGTAAKLWYKQQGSAAAAAAGSPEFLRALLRDLSPIDPLRCALTVVCFPDRRALNPEAEPNAGENIADLYYSHSGSSSSSSSSSMVAAAAAAAYDPVVLLLLGVRALRQGVLDAEGCAACGLLGVVLRALAAEDTGLRSLAYECLNLLQASLNHYLPQNPESSHPSNHKTTMQQLLKSSKLAHQITALLQFVTASGITQQQQQQQIPAAAAVLAAECALLSAAPAAVMHSTVHKLLLRQPALDVAGLPLLGRILTGGGAGRGAAAMVAEQQWLIKMLWMGLRTPLDARLYRRKYVCETLMALSGSAAANHTAAAAISMHGSSALYHVIDGYGLQEQGSASSSSSLDWPVTHLICQAIQLPGLAAHLIKSAGLLPWLAAAAATHIKAAVHWVDSSSGAAAFAQDGGGAWAIECLLQLLSARVALNHRKQAVEIYNAYATAAGCILAAAAAAVQEGYRLPISFLTQMLQLILLLLEAAPSGKARRQFIQLQLHAGVQQQLEALVGAAAAACSSGGLGSSCEDLWQGVMALVA